MQPGSLVLYPWPAHATASVPNCFTQGLLLLAPAVDISQHWQAVAQPAGVDAAGHELVLLPSAYVEVRWAGLDWGACSRRIALARPSSCSRQY